MLNGLKDPESEAIVEFIVDKYNFEGFEIDDATLVKGQLDNLNLSGINYSLSADLKLNDSSVKIKKIRYEWR